MRTLILTAVAIVLSTPVVAGPMSMTCENPRRAYFVTFDGKDLILDPDTDQTKYLVLAAHDGTVAGMVGQGSGLGFAAYFTGDSRIDLYSDDKVIQTDRCKPS